MKKLYILGALVLGLASCKPNLEPNAPERGDADFTSYLAVGNSTSAGFADGSLYLTGQLNSFPNILAQQFKTVGGGEFRQPLVNGEHGWPVAKKVLGYVQGPCDTMASVVPTDFSGALDTPGTYRNIADQGPFNNIGVPGIKVIHYGINGYAMANPFAARFFKDPATSNALDQINRTNHTFFTVWEGMNDVLDYAVKGGDQGSGTITNSMQFSTAFDSVMSTVTRNGAKGVVVTIPNILSLPYFNAIPAKGLRGIKEDQANKLNLAYNGTQVYFEIGDNYFVIEDTTEARGFRQIRDGEYVRLELPQDSVKCAGWGTTKPIPGMYVITADEVAKINAALTDFNSSIIKNATKYQIPVLDLRDYYNEVKNNGTTYNGVDYNFNFVSGGVFSLDGVHLTGRGNALLANRIIDRINTHYGSTIPYVDVNMYTGVRMP